MRLGAKIALGSSWLGFLSDWPAQDAYTRRIGCDQSDAFEPLPKGHHSLITAQAHGDRVWWVCSRLTGPTLFASTTIASDAREAERLLNVGARINEVKGGHGMTPRVASSYFAKIVF